MTDGKALDDAIAALQAAGKAMDAMIARWRAKGLDNSTSNLELKGK